MTPPSADFKEILAQEFVDHIKSLLAKNVSSPTPTPVAADCDAKGSTTTTTTTTTTSTTTTTTTTTTSSPSMGTGITATAVATPTGDTKDHDSTDDEPEVREICRSMDEEASWMVSQTRMRDGCTISSVPMITASSAATPPGTATTTATAPSHLITKGLYKLSDLAEHKEGSHIASRKMTVVQSPGYKPRNAKSAIHHAIRDMVEFKKAAQVYLACVDDLLTEINSLSVTSPSPTATSVVAPIPTPTPMPNKFQVVAAGGSITCLLRGRKAWLPNDIDLFIVGADHISDDEMNALVRRIGDHLDAYWKKTLGAQGIDSELYIYGTGGCLTFAPRRKDRVEMQRGKTTHVQLVLKRATSLAQVLYNFDLQACACAYDGANVWLTPKAKYAHEKGVNVVLSSTLNAVTLPRLWKYWSRRFDLVFPHLSPPAPPAPESSEAAAAAAPAHTSTSRSELHLHTNTQYLSVTTYLPSFTSQVTAGPRGARGNDDDETYDRTIDYNSLDKILRGNWSSLQRKGKFYCGHETWGPSTNWRKIPVSVREMVSVAKTHYKQSRCYFLGDSGFKLDERLANHVASYAEDLLAYVQSKVERFLAEAKISMPCEMTDYQRMKSVPRNKRQLEQADTALFTSGDKSRYARNASIAAAEARWVEAARELWG